MNDGGLNPLTEGLLKKDFSKDSNNLNYSYHPKS